MKTTNYYGYNAAATTTANLVCTLPMQRSGRVKQIKLGWAGVGGAAYGVFGLEVTRASAIGVATSNNPAREFILGHLHWIVAGSAATGTQNIVLNCDVPVAFGENIYVHMVKFTGTDAAAGYVTCLVTVAEAE